MCAHYVKMELKMRNMYNDIRDNMFEMIVSNDDSFEDSPTHVMQKYVPKPVI